MRSVGDKDNLRKNTLARGVFLFARRLRGLTQKGESFHSRSIRRAHTATRYDSVACDEGRFIFLEECASAPLGLSPKEYETKGEVKIFCESLPGLRENKNHPEAARAKRLAKFV